MLRRLMYSVGLLLAFGGGIIASPHVVAQAQTVRPELAAFWKAWDLAEERFVYRDALVTEKMIQGAIRGMVEALGDDGHTRYLSPDEVQIERSTQRGRFDGIGAEVNTRGGRHIVVAPLEDSPAERAGIQAGDTILMVDGEDVTSLTLTEMVAKVRGPRGTTVKLTVLHPGHSSPIEIPIVRDEVRVRAVTWAQVPGTTTAHIRINRFARDTTRELTEAIEAARSQGAASLIIDLRNNPGGLLNEAVSATSQFLKGGDVLLEQNAKGERKSYAVRSGGVAVDVPIVVVVNRGSASASEIFAGAIQDAHRAPVVGERTFGTGTVLTPIDLGDGSQLYLGVAQWLTPAGRAIRKVGIKPDVSVGLAPEARPLSPREIRGMTTSSFGASNDAQLKKALELLDPTLPVVLAPAA